MTGSAHRDRLDRLGITLILICCVIWGLKQIVVKITLPVIAPMMQDAY
jgi:hypothetical protein